MSITQVTRNIGSASAAASNTRFYLSRDKTKSDDDILLGGTRIPSLVRGGLFSGTATITTIPSSATGVYHIIACADDREVIKEISDTNNCVAGVMKVTIVR